MWSTPATESRYSFYRMGWVNPESERTTEIKFYAVSWIRTQTLLIDSPACYRWAVTALQTFNLQMSLLSGHIEVSARRFSYDLSPASVPLMATCLRNLPLATFSTPLTIAGDINLNLHQTDDVNTDRFNVILQTFDMAQHAALSTHDCGWLVVVVVTEGGQTPTSISVEDVGLWDHNLINRHVINETKMHNNIEAVLEILEAERLLNGYTTLTLSFATE